jgi:hypothetical protein
MALPSVGLEAQSLINGLLSAKEHRIGARSYRENEVYRNKKKGRHPTGPGINANFVFAGDAADIKRHPFLSAVPWEKLHLMPPPFVPQLTPGSDIAQYFESEKEILGSLSAIAPESISSAVPEVAGQQDGLDMSGRMREEFRLWLEKREEKVKDPKRRARDKVLRDPRMVGVAMGVRRVWGFGGYAWRRGHWNGMTIDNGEHVDGDSQRVGGDEIDGVD